MSFFENSPLSRRFIILQLLLMSSILVLLIHYWYLQIIRGEEYTRLSQQNRFQKKPIRALRGRIRDRHGRILADNMLTYHVVLDRTQMADRVKTTQSIATLLAVSPQIIEARMDRYENVPLFKPIILGEDVPFHVISYLESHQDEHPELGTEVGFRRSYPSQEMAAHALGYVGEINPQQLADDRHRGLRAGDLIGQSGLEQFYDHYLTGEDGWRKVLVNNVGRVLQTFDIEPSTPGNELILTLDRDLQLALEETFDVEKGAALFLDPATGEILAMVSRPAFDPNLFAQRFNEQNWNELIHNPNHPLQNRAVSGLYAPGSVFKIILTLAALEEKLITPDTLFFCGGRSVFYGRRFACWREGGHGPTDLMGALTDSCNIYFYHVGKRAGIDLIYQHARELGLGYRTGLDLAVEKTGLIPNPEWKEEHWREPWYPAETIMVSIGQGPLLITPIQAARFVASVANGGYLITPHFLKKVMSRDGELIRRYRTTREKLPYSQGTLRFLKEALWSVVNDHGTGWRARMPNLEIRGKTGSAQVVKRTAVKRNKELINSLQEHSWFVGYTASGGRPELAFAIIAEHGGSGGETAAPLLRQILSRYHENGSEVAYQSGL